jgi:non-homologous end joining protein Ku
VSSAGTLLPGVPPQQMAEVMAGGTRSVDRVGVSFGLVNVPVGLVLREPGTRGPLRRVRSRHLLPHRYKRVNQDAGEEVHCDDIVQRRRVDAGNYVIVTREEPEAVPIAAMSKSQLYDWRSSSTSPAGRR